MWETLGRFCDPYNKVIVRIPYWSAACRSQCMHQFPHHSPPEKILWLVLRTGEVFTHCFHVIANVDREGILMSSATCRKLKVITHEIHRGSIVYVPFWNVYSAIAWQEIDRVGQGCPWFLGDLHFLFLSTRNWRNLTLLSHFKGLGFLQMLLVGRIAL